MNKKHDIKTIEQILEVVNADNVENFKKDFCSWLDFKVGMVEAMKIFKVDNNIEEVIQDLKVFHWIDDGKNDATINFKITTKIT